MSDVVLAGSASTLFVLRLSILLEFQPFGLLGLSHGFRVGRYLCPGGTWVARLHCYTYVSCKHNFDSFIDLLFLPDISGNPLFIFDGCEESRSR